MGHLGRPRGGARAREAVPGADVVELGCGHGLRLLVGRPLGFRPVAVDVAPAARGRRRQEELGLTFPLIHANAEDVPYETDSFDLAISEYGASLWCEPHRWLAEADRLLRPGGGLIFVTNSLAADGVHAGERRARRRPAPTRLLHEPRARVPGRRRRVPPDARELDRAPERLRVLGRAARRAAAAARHAAALRLRVDRVGAALAQRGDLGRAQAQ